MGLAFMAILIALVLTRHSIGMGEIWFVIPAFLFLGKGIGPITPYGSVGRMYTNARGIIPASGARPEITLSDKSSVNRYTAGVRLNLFLPKIVIEATQAEERSYAAKVSFGF